MTILTDRECLVKAVCDGSVTGGGQSAHNAQDRLSTAERAKDAGGVLTMGRVCRRAQRFGDLHDWWYSGKRRPDRLPIRIGKKTCQVRCQVSEPGLP